MRPAHETPATRGVCDRPRCGNLGACPSRRHELLARVVPRLRKSRDLDTPEAERARLERWHATLDRALPDRRGAAASSRRFAVVREELPARLPVVRRHPARAATPSRTVVYLHGGGFVAPIDPFQVRYAARLASGLRRPGGDARLPADARSTPGATRTSRSSTLVAAAADVAGASCSPATPPAAGSRWRWR